MLQLRTGYSKLNDYRHINLGRLKQGTVSVGKLKLYNTTFLSVHCMIKLDKHY